MDSDPLNADQRCLPSATTVSVDGQSYLQIALNKSAIAPVDYAVKVSFDKRNWNSGEFFTETVVDTPTRLLVHSSVAMHLLDSQFMRLVAKLQP